MKVILFNAHPNLEFDTEKDCFIIGAVGVTTKVISSIEMLRFLKTKYTNSERFMSGFIDPINALLNQNKDVAELDTFRHVIDYFANTYDVVDAFSYAEVFAMKSRAFRAVIFGSIRVPEMIKQLGHTRIATAGQPVKHKQYSKQGEFLGFKEYDVVFETHEVDGRKLGTWTPVHAVRCWCTTTDNEHWLWIDSAYKDDPLEAIARTFYIHENLVPHIKELKRQGDILLVELTQDIDPRGNMVSLSKEQYFGLLTAQS
jgi:hypothetical protein